jgi:hypothetical protein
MTSRGLVAAMLAICVAAVGCGPGTERASGLVTAIDTLGLGRVQGFTLRTPDGEVLEFVFEGGTDLSAGGWPPDHLQEHLAMAEGVAVEYRVVDGRRVAIRLGDAAWVGE